jgi:hypothetical protein
MSVCQTQLEQVDWFYIYEMDVGEHQVFFLPQYCKYLNHLKSRPDFKKAKQYGCQKYAI